LLFNNSGELCRLDDFAPFGECDMNNISLLPCLNNGICDLQKTQWILRQRWDVGKVSICLEKTKWVVDDAARTKQLDL